MKNIIKKIKKVISRQYIYYKGRRFDQKIKNFSKLAVLVRTCPVCGCEDKDFKWDKLGFKVYSCKNCQFDYVTPVMDGNILNRFYSKAYFFDYRAHLGHVIKGESNKEELIRCQRIVNYFLESINSNSSNQESKKWLDIGCSTGELLYAAKEKGFFCEGIEINDWAAEQTEKNLEIIVHKNPLINSSINNNSFDVISYIDVLEHINDPGKELEKANNVLSKNGYLLILIPDFKSKIAIDQKQNWTAAKPWEHINMFGLKDLSKLLEKKGFKSIAHTDKSEDGVGYEGALIVIAKKS